MSVQDRYSKIIESLVNGEGEVASDLLHEAFVDKAREIWSGLVEQDEIVEDDISEEEIEESYFDEDVDSFEEEIAAEEEYAMEDEGEEEEFDAEGEAEFELASDDEMDMDMDAEGDMEPESEAGIEDAMLSVEDALADLKAEFAQLMGDDLGDEEEAGLSDELPADDFASDIEPEAEEEFEEQLAFESDEAEELEEAADLTKIGKDGMHPSEMPAGDDGKASPVAGKNDMGGKVIPTGAKGSEGSKKGLSDESAKDMGVTHPGEGASLKPETRGHGAEKRGMKQ